MMDWPSGMKKTKQRMAIKEVLESAERPLSAIEIASRIGGGSETAWLSTVYRTLEMFEKENMVMKVSLMDEGMALYVINRFEHKHYAVCVSCHKVTEMENCPMEAFIPELADADFQILGHKLEIQGYCQICKDTAI